VALLGNNLRGLPKEKNGETKVFRNNKMPKKKKKQEKSPKHYEKRLLKGRSLIGRRRTVCTKKGGREKKLEV